MDGPNWRALLSNTDGVNTANFVERVNDVIFFKKCKLLRRLTGPLSALVHHLERGDARASNVYPLYTALEAHAIAWAEDAEIIRYFSTESREAVLLKIRRRWRGDLPLRIGLKCPEYFVAFLLDPCTTPSASDLPDDWEDMVRVVFKPFCKDADEMGQVVEAVMGLVLDRQSVWGKKILEKQAANQPPASMNFGSIVDREIYKQKRQPSPTLAWQVDGTRVHTLLAEVGVRLSMLAIQSADVERVCKAHKVIHTKARNRLRNKVVYTLLFTYVNLRLINKVKTELGDFLMQAIDNELLDPARGEDEDTDEEEEVVPEEHEGGAAAGGAGHSE